MTERELEDSIQFLLSCREQYSQALAEVLSPHLSQYFKDRVAWVDDKIKQLNERRIQGEKKANP